MVSLEHAAQNLAREDVRERLGERGRRLLWGFLVVVGGGWWWINFQRTKCSSTASSDLLGKI